MLGAQQDEWVTCPYDPRHRVPRLRVQAHLVKCEERHPPLAICPYNATHRMPQAQMAAHVKNSCSTREALCLRKLSPERSPPRPRAKPIEPDELWDL